jgi:AcrR family transcriptional regulator
VTFTAGSCKSLSHELAQGRAPRRARLPSRQSEGGAAAGGARPDCGERPRRVHLRRCRAFGRHFRDRDELLSSIAQRGFEQFEAALTQAWDDGRPDTVTAFERVGKAYLAFAREEPAFYSAMFESGLPVDLNPTLQAASERAFGIIRAAAERLAALAPPGVPRPPAMMMALHIWSMSHGVASLFGRGDAARRKLPMSPEDLLEAQVLIYLRGLGFPTDRRPGQKDQADQKPATPPPVPPAGPWGTPK